MLFHTGVLRRLCQTRWLQQADRISSVSGGSMTAAILALAWSKVTTSSDPDAAFVEQVEAPIRALAARTIDRSAVVSGLLSPFSSIGEEVEGELRRHLLGTATLADLPAKPVFVFNATNLQTGSLWRFSKPFQPSQSN